MTFTGDEPFELKKCIANGNFSKVYLAVKADSTQVACKVVKTAKMQREKVLREIFILNKLKGCKGIIAFDCYWEEPEQICILMQLCNRGTLAQRLKPKVGEAKVPITSEERIDYLRQMCDILMVLKNNRIVHCDIKLENILINENNELLLADFGLADIAGRMEKTSGSPNYMAPEFFDYTAPHPSYSTDLWAVGVTFFFLCTGGPPFSTRGTPLSLMIANVKARLWGSIEQRKVLSSKELTIFESIFTEHVDRCTPEQVKELCDDT